MSPLELFFCAGLPFATALVGVLYCEAFLWRTSRSDDQQVVRPISEIAAERSSMDYRPFIVRALERDAPDNAEERQTFYDRVRTALMTQLKNVEPPLSESEIIKERMALESTIDEVEAEVARKRVSDQIQAAMERAVAG